MAEFRRSPVDMEFISHYPYHPCMVYLPTFGCFLRWNMGNVGKYTIHGCYGLFAGFQKMCQVVVWDFWTINSSIEPKYSRKNISNQRAYPPGVWHHRQWISTNLGGVPIANSKYKESFSKDRMDSINSFSIGSMGLAYLPTRGWSLWQCR